MAKENHTNIVQTFQSPLGTELRVFVRGGEPWFVGKDVAEALGYQKTQNAVLNHVDEEDKTTALIQGTGSNYKSNKVLINESGLYSLILSSKLPQAREFKRWVTAEVLPQIRKTGGYIPIHRNNENENENENYLAARNENENCFAKSLNENSLAADAPSAKRAVASDEEILCRALQILQRTIEQKDRLLGVQSEALADMEPKALFHDAVQGAEEAIGISQLAKLLRQNGIEIGQRRLFRWMREHGYMGRVGEFFNIPQQRYLEQGLFCIQEFAFTDSLGRKHTTLTPKVTGKGQTYFVKLFCQPQ